MGREHAGGSPKPHNYIDHAKRKRITYIFSMSCLCIVFYTLGVWQGKTPAVSTKFQQQNSILDRKIECTNKEFSDETKQGSNNNNNNLDFESHHKVELNSSDESAVKPFPACEMSYSEYTPCQDPRRGRKFDRYMLKYRERHCPTKDEMMMCLIPPPPKYKTPFKWPQSRDIAWYDNIPHKELSIEKAIQNWIQVEGDRFRFPGGGTMFPRGADAYIDDISSLIPLTNGNIRTAIDTGCGVCHLFLSF